jgi:hypothetical protein
MPISDEGRENIRRGHEGRDKESYRENNPREDRIAALEGSDPAGYRELLKKIAAKMLVPHSEGQKEVLTAEERFLILCAGRRWGKTKVGAAKALRMARKGKIVWWVSPQYKIVKRGYDEVVAQLPQELLTKPAPPGSAFDAGRSVRLDFKTGGRIEFYSAERPEGMLGGSCDYLIMDEAATMPEHVWTQIIRPTLADRQGSALFISTPRGRNWFYYLWQRGQNELDTEYRSWHFPSRTNPTIPSAEFDQMAQEMPAVDYEQEVLAQFISESASVFRLPTDDEGNYTCVKPFHTPLGHVVLGIDLAKHNDWTVLCGVRASDRMPCFHERFNNVSWPQQRERIHDAVETIMESASGITILMDVGGPGDVVFDDLEEEGLDIIPINFTKWKEPAVKLLASDLEQGRAFINDDQLSEFQHYGYTITAAGRWKYEAARGHDDEVSAMLLAHWGVVHEGPPNVQTLTVDDTGQYEDERTWYDEEDEGPIRVDTGLAKVTQIQLGPGLTLPPGDPLNDERFWH